MQKSAVKLILGEKYIDYEKSLIQLDMESLFDKRENLGLNFALKCVRNPKTKHMFPESKKTHQMETCQHRNLQLCICKIY